MKTLVKVKGGLCGSLELRPPATPFVFRGGHIDFLRPCSTPVRTPGVQVENMSSVSPACRKRRLKGRRYIAIVADTA